MKYMKKKQKKAPIKFKSRSNLRKAIKNAKMQLINMNTILKILKCLSYI